VKIFGTIYPFVETGSGSYMLGRHVANFEFLRALLSANEFDEYHLFCMNASHVRMTVDKINHVSLPAKIGGKIKIFKYDDLINRLKVTEYYVFHLGGWGYFFAGLVHLRNNYAKAPFPITGVIHSMNGVETNYHAHKIIYAPLMPYDTVVCTSEAGRRVFNKTVDGVSEALNLHGAKVSYSGGTKMIPLGVDDDFEPPADKLTCRRKLGLPEDAFITLMLGRFSIQTKMDLFPALQCQKRLTQAKLLRPAHMVIAGGGTAKDIMLVKEMILELGIGDSTTLVTNFETHKKTLLYGAADAYLSVSDNIQETFGISVVEAMMAGVPPVVSDINGYKELLEHDVHGFKVPTCWIEHFDRAKLAEIMNFETMQLMLAQCMAVDSEVMYESLFTLATEPERAEKMGAAAKEHARGNYSWFEIMKQYHAMWDALWLQAKNSEALPFNVENAFINEYLKVFSHYPTMRLSDELICRITPVGRNALADGRVPASYEDIQSLLEVDYQGAILGTLSNGDFSVGDIIKRRPSGMSESDAGFNILWMAKYSLLAISKIENSHVDAHFLT